MVDPAVIGHPVLLTTEQRRDVVVGMMLAAREHLLSGDRESSERANALAALFLSGGPHDE